MQLENRTQGEVVARPVRVLDTWWSRGWGLTFHRPLKEGEAFWFQLDRPGRRSAAIHMFFVFFPLGVVWVDEEGRVVDQVLARPFRPWYAPAAPAAAFVEGTPSLLDRCAVGDLLVLVPEEGV